MSTQIVKTTRAPSPDPLSGEFYWLLGVLLLSATALLITMRMPAEVIDPPAFSPGL